MAGATPWANSIFPHATKITILLSHLRLKKYCPTPTPTSMTPPLTFIVAVYVSSSLVSSSSPDIAEVHIRIPTGIYQGV